MHCGQQMWRLPATRTNIDLQIESCRWTHRGLAHRHFLAGSQKMTALPQINVPQFLASVSISKIQRAADSSQNDRSREWARRFSVVVPRDAGEAIVRTVHALINRRY